MENQHQNDLLQVLKDLIHIQKNENENLTKLVEVYKAAKENEQNLFHPKC